MQAHEGTLREQFSLLSTLYSQIAISDLLFTYDFPPMGGGISRCVEALARHYPPGTLRVSTGTLPGASQVDATFPNQIDRIGTSSHRLKTLLGLREWSARAVTLASLPATRFAWCGQIRPAAYPAWWARHRTGLPYGLLVYGGDLLILRRKLQLSALKRTIVRKIFNDAAAIVAISSWTAERLSELLEEFDMRPAGDRLHTVPLGTDPDRWRPDATKASAFRKERALPEGRWLVTVARLVPHKGVDTGIRVLAALLPEFPDLRYAIVGRGGYQEHLVALAHELGVAERVHILSDVSDADLPASYAVGEIYLGLSRETATDVEGFGISLLEAAAMELPTVAGASGGIPDAVAKGVTGMLVDPNTPDAAVAAVRALLNNPAEALRMGKAGRARVLAGFTWPRFAERMNEIAYNHGRAR